jgi:P27 family predicted phage terminase small subunit
MSREAKAVWKRTAEQLRTMGLLFEADQDVLAAYVAAVVNFQKATKIVDTEGVVVEGRRDGMVTNPAVRVQRDAAQQIRMLAGELGLTPASRTRLKAEETSDDSDILD